MAINLTKGEFLCPNGQMKLTEHSFFTNDYTMRLTQLLAPRGSWHGDRLLVAGDYTEIEDWDLPDEWRASEKLNEHMERWVKNDVDSHMREFFKGRCRIVNGVHERSFPSRTEHKSRPGLAEIENERLLALELAEFDYMRYLPLDIHSFAKIMFKENPISKKHERQFAELRINKLPGRFGHGKLIAGIQGGRYFLNHDKKEYIDSMDAIPQDMTEDPIPVADWYLFPLTILLAISNGRGGGDYSGYHVKGPDGDYVQEGGHYKRVIPGEDYIGYWAGDSISATNKPPAGYNYIDPMFTEREALIQELSVEQSLKRMFPNMFNTKAV